MKKTILGLIVLATLVSADMCKYDLRTATKYSEKMHYAENSSTKLNYATIARDSLVDAKYECPESVQDHIVSSIEKMNDLIESLKD